MQLHQIRIPQVHQTVLGEKPCGKALGFMWCGLLANEVVAAPPNKICYQAARLSVVSWQVAQHCFAMWWQMQLKELQRTP